MIETFMRGKGMAMLNLFRRAMKNVASKVKEQTIRKVKPSSRRSRLFLDALVPSLKPENKAKIVPPDPKPEPQPKPKLILRKRLWAGLMPHFLPSSKKDDN